VGAVDNFSTTSRFFLPEPHVRGISILTVKGVRQAFDRQNDEEPLKKAIRGGGLWLIVAQETHKE
jgi:hypothetical protein